MLIFTSIYYFSTPGLQSYYVSIILTVQLHIEHKCFYPLLAWIGLNLIKCSFVPLFDNSQHCPRVVLPFLHLDIHYCCCSFVFQRLFVLGYLSLLQIGLYTGFRQIPDSESSRLGSNWSVSGLDWSEMYWFSQAEQICKLISVQSTNKTTQSANYFSFSLPPSTVLALFSKSHIFKKCPVHKPQS